MHHSRFFQGLLAFLIVLSAGTAHAQQDSPDRGDSKVFDLAFPGGNALEYIALVDERSGGVNIVAPEEARFVMMPQMNLMSVNARAALHLLQSRSGRTDRHDIRLALDLVQVPQSEPIFVVHARVDSLHQRSSRTTVWSVANILGAGIKVEDMLTAVETALELQELQADDGARPGGVQIRFHEATGILIARGSDEQLHVVEEVLGRLFDARLEGYGQAAAQEDNERAVMARHIEELTQVNRQLHERVRKLEQQLAGTRPN